MDIKEILDHLPHRYPFLLVDRVVDFEIGKSIHAYKNISINEQFFMGHFPHHPVMPGVLIMEGAGAGGGNSFVQDPGLETRRQLALYFVGTTMPALNGR